ncbi:DNA-directed DNA polymerase II small subunit [Candidatus Woesearchaeota archaeon]|nr:DNA-directed DNA polymerase II small subunit [Candidatus Woesearchaeota archaeon]
MKSKQEIVTELIKAGVLITPDFLQNNLIDENLLNSYTKIETIPEDESNNLIDVKTKVEIIFNYNKATKKKDISHFVSYFRKRYETLSNLLMRRPELANVISINRLWNKQLKETVAIIGLVSSKEETKNGHFILEIEDLTGKIKVLINKERKEIAKNIILDEVIGVIGSIGDKIVFSSEIIYPDVPLTKELKKSPDEICAAFISDIHVGSKMFLPEDFERFIDWLNGNVGSEKQKQFARRIKYLFVAGDIVDGVGIYPSQENELNIKDIAEQYKTCAEYLNKIRKDVHIIICPGNHDAVRIGEPQPALINQFTEPLTKMSNVILVSNPAIINIHKTDYFPGFDVLMYHGYSFDSYVSNVDSIREGGGYDRADLIMKFLLQKRHLAPTYASTLYFMDNEEDPLIIKTVPDFFVTGHIHKTNVSNYNNISLICGSCWQSKTNFQEKVGHNPEPSRVPVVNLKTREIKILRFGNENLFQ